MGEKLKKIKKFYKEHKVEICLCTITAVSLIFVYKTAKELRETRKNIKKIAQDEVDRYIVKYNNQLDNKIIGTNYLLDRKIDGTNKRMDRVSDDIEKFSIQVSRSFKKLKDAEALVWPLRNYQAISSVTETPGLSGWGGALRGAGIFTVGDLIREVRENEGPEFIESIPGIGEVGYESIITFLSKNTTPEFKKIYLEC